MPKITLQMSFDSSFIDFNIESEDNFLHKVSLLSVGNSYDTFTGVPEDMIINSCYDLRNFLLPWNNADETDRPTHFRAWRVAWNVAQHTYRVVNAPIDFPVSNAPSLNLQDTDLIIDYYSDKILEQVTSKQHLLLDITGNIDIDIDENYVADDTRQGKAHSATAQMAQKLFPFNERLNFLYLSNDETQLEFSDLEVFYATEASYFGFVFFPVSTAPDSVWFTEDGNRPSIINDTDIDNLICLLSYKNTSTVRDFTVNRVAYSKPTELPKSEVTQGNVTLRKEGKYVGEVKISVEQGNDWKVNFTAELAKVLDLREMFMQGKTVERTIKNEAYIQNVFDYFLNPFLTLSSFEGGGATATEAEKHPFWYSIEKLIIDTAIAKNNEGKTDNNITESQINKEIDSVKEEIKNYLTTIISNLQKDPQAITLKWIVRELLLQGEGLFTQRYTDAVAFEAALQKLHTAFSDSKNQAFVLSVLCHDDFKDMTLHDNKSEETIKVENGTIIYRYLLTITDPVTRIPKVTTAIKTITVVDIFNFDIFYLFNHYLLHYGKIKGDGIDEKLLSYLLDEDSFDTEHLKAEIATKVYGIFADIPVDIAKTLKLFYGTTVEFAKQSSIDHDDAEYVTGLKIKSFADKEEKPSADQLPIRIQIGKPNEITPDSKDDLSDELSGYVMLSTRSENSNDESSFNNSWKYHHRAKVKISLNGETTINPLEGSFLVPGYMPVENETQKIFLEISNEKASLTATLEGLNDTITEGGKDTNSKIVYLLEKARENNPYGLLYGYYYQFSAFAILNSGVLPEVLRHPAGTLNTFNENPEITDNILKEPYYYLRTKNVSSPNVKLIDIKKYPGGLNPLYLELYGESADKNNIETKSLIISGKGFNESFNLIVEKPRTSFWDCYSFVHDGGDDPIANMKPYKILDTKEEFTDYIDPAVSQNFYVEIETKHSLMGSPEDTIRQVITYDGKALYEDGRALNLEKCSKKFLVKLDTNATNIILNTSGVTLMPGGIYSVRFYNLVDTKYFNFKDKDNYKFKHKLYDFDKTEVTDEAGTKYYKIAYEEQIIETAISWVDINPKPNDFIPTSASVLWDSLEFSESLYEKQMLNPEPKNSNLYAVLNTTPENKFKILSRVKVAHQLWDWNGRQMNIDLNKFDNTNINPQLPNPQTSPGMVFDAWAFSERPDHTAFIKESRVYAAGENRSQVVHNYPALIDNHAMYFRYAVEVFNRYELLNSVYGQSVKSGIIVNNTSSQWKRHIKKSKRTEPLPTPAVRFYIPLTNSIEEAHDNEAQVADVMLVLDDVWYKEGGLAQKLKLGIKKTKNPNSESFYPEAGYDPTLSLTKTEPLLAKTQTLAINDDADYLIVDDQHIKGPLGFTFDFSTTNAKINSSSFVISGDGLSSYITKKVPEDGHWPMYKLAVRSEILPELHKHETDFKADTLNSKWGSAQWVQFMKALDSFVPARWRNEVRRNGFVTASKPVIDIEPKMFNQFGATFWHYHNWYLIFSTVESNIGGLPVENYYDTFIVNGINTTLTSLKSVHSQNKTIQGFTEGYVRIMIARKSDDYDIQKTTENVWGEIFGAARDNEDKIRKDNTLSMPILSERIPIKIKPI